MRVLNWGLRRKLGQHFLVQECILQALAAATCREYAPRVVEIGPGRGALTAHLLRCTNELHVIELDRSLVASLERRFAGDTKLHVHAADILETDIAQWGAAVVTGNLPYYITSPIINKFLNLDSRFVSGVFLVQWEVAQRLLASPGTRDYGYLTVSTQLICEVELICRVPASAFAPPPTVESAGVRLTRRTDIPANRIDLLKFASRAFAQKRKNLRNNLRPFYGDAIDHQPEATLRAEQLSIPAFIGLYERLTPPVH